MDKLLLLLLCVAFFYWGYYDYPNSKNKVNPKDNEYERNYKKIDHSRSLILMVVSALGFSATIVRMILELNDK